MTSQLPYTIVQNTMINIPEITQEDRKTTSTQIKEESEIKYLRRKLMLLYKSQP